MVSVLRSGLASPYRSPAIESFQLSRIARYVRHLAISTASSPSLRNFAALEASLDLADAAKIVSQLLASPDGPLRIDEPTLSRTASHGRSLAGSPASPPPTRSLDSQAIRSFAALEASTDQTPAAKDCFQHYPQTDRGRMLLQRQPPLTLGLGATVPRTFLWMDFRAFGYRSDVCLCAAPNGTWKSLLQMSTPPLPGAPFATLTVRPRIAKSQIPPKKPSIRRPVPDALRPLIMTCAMTMEALLSAAFARLLREGVEPHPGHPDQILQRFTFEEVEKMWSESRVMIGAASPLFAANARLVMEGWKRTGANNEITYERVMMVLLFTKPAPDTFEALTAPSTGRRAQPATVRVWHTKMSEDGQSYVPSTFPAAGHCHRGGPLPPLLVTSIEPYTDDTTQQQQQQQQQAQTRTVTQEDAEDDGLDKQTLEQQHRQAQTVRTDPPIASQPADRSRSLRFNYE